MRERPYAFLQLGRRWINMSQVTDIEDHGERLVVFLSSEMARMAGAEGDAVPLDVSRRIVFSEPDEVAKLRRWLKLNDED